MVLIILLLLLVFFGLGIIGLVIKGLLERHGRGGGSRSDDGARSRDRE